MMFTVVVITMMTVSKPWFRLNRGCKVTMVTSVMPMVVGLVSMVIRMMSMVTGVMSKTVSKVVMPHYLLRRRPTRWKPSVKCRFYFSFKQLIKLANFLFFIAMRKKAFFHLLAVNIKEKNCRGICLPNFDVGTHYYRPPTKFAKVMFSQVFVCPRGGDTHPPGQTPPGQTPPWEDAPPGQMSTQADTLRS